MKIEELQAGDVFVFERASAVVTSVYQRPGGTTYTLGAALVCVEFPPGIMEQPAGDIGALVRVLRPKLHATEVPR